MNNKIYSNWNQHICVLKNTTQTPYNVAERRAQTCKDAQRRGNMRKDAEMCAKTRKGAQRAAKPRKYLQHRDRQNPVAAWATICKICNCPYNSEHESIYKKHFWGYYFLHFRRMSSFYILFWNWGINIYSYVWNNIGP